MKELTCRGCNNELDNCTCNVLTKTYDEKIANLEARIKELENENEQLKKNLAGTSLALTIINSKSRYDNHPPLIVKGVTIKQGETFIPSVIDRRE